MVVKKITIKDAPDPTIKRIKIKYRQSTPLDILYDLHHPIDDYESKYISETPRSPSQEIDAIPWTLDPEALNAQLFATLEPRLLEHVARVLEGGSRRVPRWRDFGAAMYGYLVVKWGSKVGIEEIEEDKNWFWGMVCALEEELRESTGEMLDVDG
jgi:hypothetical protein